MKIEKQNVEIYWIARNEDNSIIHYSKNNVGDEMETGQPIIETFTTEQEWNNRLIELNINIE